MIDKERQRGKEKEGDRNVTQGARMRLRDAHPCRVDYHNEIARFFVENEIMQAAKIKFWAAVVVE